MVNTVDNAIARAVRDALTASKFPYICAKVATEADAAHGIIHVLGFLHTNDGREYAVYYLPAHASCGRMYLDEIDDLDARTNRRNRRNGDDRDNDDDQDNDDDSSDHYYNNSNNGNDNQYAYSSADEYAAEYSDDDDENLFIPSEIVY